MRLAKKGGGGGQTRGRSIRHRLLSTTHLLFVHLSFSMLQFWAYSRGELLYLSTSTSSSQFSVVGVSRIGGTGSYASLFYTNVS